MASVVETGVREFTISGLAASTMKRGLGVLLTVTGLALGIALLGFDPSDPSLSHQTNALATNPLGEPGAVVADMLLQIFGVASALLPISLTLWGGRLVVNRPLLMPWVPVIALPIALLALSAFLAAQTVPEGHGWPYRVGLGGFVGDYELFSLQPALGADGYFWGSFAAALVTCTVAIGVSWSETVWLIRGFFSSIKWLFGGFFRLLGGGFSGMSTAVGARVARQLQEDPDHNPNVPFRPVRAGRKRGAADPLEGDPLVGHERAAGNERAGNERASGGRAGDAKADEPAAKPARRTWLDPFNTGSRNKPAETEPAEPETPVRLRTVQANMADDDIDVDATQIMPRRKSRAAKAAKPDDERQESLDLDTFKLPALNFLTRPGAKSSTAPSAARLKEMSAELETVLDDFGVRGQIIDATPGPVVTMFELEPAPGTRAARVISLADDIARSLCAMSVRVAVVPGRNVIGIELPNEKRETVFLRALLESDVFDDSQARLALALGKDIMGNPIVVDLARMPHLLIAGTTGSGKSVAINAMILSLLYRLTPQQCRIIMIDPKVIELSVYEDIPHLLAPVVTEPHKAVVALKWVVRQMDERYRLMSHLGVRDIFAYNRRLEQARARGEELKRRVRTGFEPGTGAPIYEEMPIDMTPLPLIVIIVDEVADLMLTAGKEIEGAIQRLSQKARAAGIHLIVATQRPSVDVLTGVIKANLPSRISFRVSSKIDSRTILGEPGAEQLLGQGDMLYLMPGDRISRIHGALVTDDEVEGVVAHLKAQGFPDYHAEVTSDGGGGELGVDDAPAFESDDKDDLYNQAVQIVARDGKASTSYLQRKLSIGYNSAAKLIERMESEGLISAADHVGRRQVLMGKGGVDGDEPTDL